MTPSQNRIVSAALVAVAGVATVVAARGPVSATSAVTTDRFAGTNRYDTARLIGTAKVFGAPTQAVLASGDNYPDALAAAFLAGAYKAPIFLTAAHTLSPEALQGLKDLGVKQVTIVGGPLAVAPAEESSLTANGITPTRIGGGARDGTAALVAQAPGTTVGSYRSQGPSALIAADNDAHYVDALSAGPLSWSGHLPILLTGTDTLAPEAQAALTALKIQHAVIVGGTAAVAASVEGAINNMGITTERLQGDTRQRTAVAVANAEGFGLTHVDLAVGNNFPDALAGAPFGGVQQAPTLLTNDPNDLSTPTHDFIAANNGTINHVTAFGGTNAISDPVLSEASSTATCAPPTTTTTSTTAAASPLAALSALTASPSTTTTTAAPLPTCAGAPAPTSTDAPTTTTSTTTTAAPGPGLPGLPAPGPTQVTLPSGLPAQGAVSVNVDPNNPFGGFCVTEAVTEKSSGQTVNQTFCVPA